MCIISSMRFMSSACSSGIGAPSSTGPSALRNFMAILLFVLVEFEVFVDGIHGRIVLGLGNLIPASVVADGCESFLHLLVAQAGTPADREKPLALGTSDGRLKAYHFALGCGLLRPCRLRNER